MVARWKLNPKMRALATQPTVSPTLVHHIQRKDISIVPNIQVNIQAHTWTRQSAIPTGSHKVIKLHGRLRFKPKILGVSFFINWLWNTYFIVLLAKPMVKSRSHSYLVTICVENAYSGVLEVVVIAWEVP